MYKITLFLKNEFQTIYPTVIKYIENKGGVERFLSRAMKEGGILVLDIATNVSKLTHNRNISYAEAVKIDPSEVETLPYVVEAVK